MIDVFIEYLRRIVIEFGSFGVFIASFTEQVIPMIPTFLIVIMATLFLIPPEGHFLLILGKIMLIISLPAALGGTLGSLIFYFLSYLGGKPLINKAQGWLGLKWEDIEELKKRFDHNKSDELAIFILWLLPTPSLAIAILCGAVRYPALKYILLALVGIFLRATTTSLVGWQAGAMHLAIEDLTILGNYFLIGLTLLILTGIIFLIYKKYRRIL